MSEQIDLPDRQQEHLAGLQSFINQPDSKIIAAGYKKVIEDSNETGLFFDFDKPGGEEAFQRTMQAFKDSGSYLVAEADFSDDDKEGLAMKRLAHSVGMSDESIADQENGLSLVGKVLQFLEDREEEQKKPVAFFWKRPDLLSISSQARLRAFQQNYGSESEARFFGLFSWRELDSHSEEWLTSPLPNVFQNAADREGVLTFDPEKGRGTIATYRRAIGDLSKVGVGRVVLPSGTGKSSFGRILEKMTAATRFIDLEAYCEEGGKSVDISKLPQEICDKKIPIFDEAQILTKEQKIELVKRYGKVIFVENSDFIRR